MAVVGVSLCVSVAKDIFSLLSPCLCGESFRFLGQAEQRLTAFTQEIVPVLNEFLPI